MVETQLCTLRDASDTLAGRAYYVVHLTYGVCELNLRYDQYSVPQVLRKTVRACSTLNPHVKDVGR